MALQWEMINCVGHNFNSASFMRAKVPGGWLLMARISLSPTITFYPAPNHEWKGDSLP